MPWGNAKPALLGLVLLAGCAGSPPREASDSAPSHRRDLANVADAVPRPEAHSRGGNYSPYTVLGKTYHVMSSADDYREQGIASWYGSKFHGRLTSNGEVYDAYGMTAAHRSLPLPTYVRVTNLENGRKITVRVNDRGPFHDQRLIDLSYAAAYKLGFHDSGTARVEVQALQTAAPATQPALVAGRRAGTPTLPDRLFLQVGAFRSLDGAESLKAALLELLDESIFIDRSKTASEPWYRVRIGPLRNADAVAVLQRRVNDASLGMPMLVRD